MAARVRGLCRLVPSLEGLLLFPLMVGGLRHDLLIRWVLPRCHGPRLWLGCLGTPTSQPGGSWSLGLRVASLPMKETGQAAPGHQGWDFIANEGDWLGDSWSLGLHGALSPVSGAG